MPTPSQLDDLIRRVGKATSWNVLAHVADAKGPMAGYARELLTAPRAAASMEGVDDFLRANGMRIGHPISRGRESLVFNAVDKEGRNSNVLKLQSLGSGRGFTLPTDVPGVAGYWAKDRIGSGPLVALQAKASRVLSPDVRARWGGIAEESKWSQMADTVQRSLAARGMEWTDPHAGNIGIMPDENMAVLDGAIYARDASDPLPARASISPEDAVRLLRQY
jgi:hypothetical protein